ncbi:hypothetical protein RIF29_27555 [Crotalaria pallida]|uniref:Phytosulfokine n=1 Tax=Crotalaria pallida TaxID=3830 RepID=A0AAN9HYV3_CROPI
MKLSFHIGALLVFLIVLFSSTKLCARPLATEQGQNREVDKATGDDFVLELEGGESLKQVLGKDECKSGGEECLMRRMTLEAHIDYIYTDHHKP